METLLYIFARALIGFIQALPLRFVARLGRTGGALFYSIDARHRRVAQENLQSAFPEKPANEIRALAKENFKRIGENFSCAAKTAGMANEEIADVVEVSGIEKLRKRMAGENHTSFVFAIGHFGNFELFARCFMFVPGYKFATTYRGLRQQSLNRLLQSLREKSGCLFFERRTDADRLKAAMNEGAIMLGLLADQHAGDKGLRLQFFGRDCSTNPAPAILALRYNTPLFTAICYRTDLGKWRIEVGDEIPLHENEHPRPTSDIMQDVNRALELAVRRDPANWFWVHKRWKSPGRETKTQSLGSETKAVIDQ